MYKKTLSMLMAVFLVSAIAPQSAAASGVISDNFLFPVNDTAHTEVFCDEIVEGISANGDIKVPANTAVCIAQTDFASSYLLVGVDCPDKIRFGIINSGGKFEETRMTGRWCKKEFSPETEGNYYVYLYNDTDEDTTASFVVETFDWQILMKTRNVIHVKITK